MSLGKHADGRRPLGKLALLLALAMVVSAFAVGPLVSADVDPPKKVWLCHFDTNHQAVQPYADDRNGIGTPGFWTVGAGAEEGTFLTGDYIVRYNSDTYVGVPEGLNPGQIALCEGNGGEFITVSVNALGSFDDVKGHRALLQERNLTNGYPAGWKGPQS